MRRIAAAAALMAPVVLALGVVTASAAQATQINGGTLTSGASVTGTISHPGDTIAYKFAATKNYHVDFDVTRTNWGANGGAALRWYRPDGSYVDQCIVTTAAKVCDVTPDVTGTWTMALEPGDDSVGYTTFTFANDVNIGALKADIPTAVKFTLPGQGLVGAFTATAGHNVTVNTSAFNLGTNGSARLTFYEPDGTVFTYCVLFGATPDPCIVVPDQSGTMLMQLQPTDTQVGTLNLTYAPDQYKALANGVPVTTAIPSVNENAFFTMSLTAGVPVSVPITAAGWGSTGSAYLYFFSPASGHPLFTHCADLTTAVCTFTPNLTGTWSAELDPQGASVGSTTFGYVADQVGGALTGGHAVTATIGTAGQNADYTFAATNGTHVSFDVSATNWGTGNAQLRFFTPTGVYAYACTIAATPTYCDLTPNSTGTWTVVLDPQGSATGAATFTYAPDQNKGAIVKGTPVTTAIAQRGQNARYTIAATSGVKITVKVTAANWAGGSAALELFPPSGSPLFANCVISTATTCTYTPNSTGTWNFQLDPSGATTGSTTFVTS